MTDNGARALTERLHNTFHHDFRAWNPVRDDTCMQHAAAILANGAAFLPAGIDGLLNDYDLQVVAPLEVELDRLRRIEAAARAYIAGRPLAGLAAALAPEGSAGT